jgi:hypothetical protein
VTEEVRPAPYPADTQARGWKFELDYDAIEKSDTWPLAAEIPMAQHALLMMWLTAWSKQKPCGSFPNDENIIRATCRIPPAVWAKCRDVLMRGWWLADDGRYYSNILVPQVLELISRRARGYLKHREDVIDRCGAACRYCGRSDLRLALDHVIPRIQGGSDDAENLVPACKPCNSSKGGRTPEQWRASR